MREHVFKELVPYVRRKCRFATCGSVIAILEPDKDEYPKELYHRSSDWWLEASNIVRFSWEALKKAAEQPPPGLYFCDGKYTEEPRAGAYRLSEEVRYLVFCGSDAGWHIVSDTAARNYIWYDCAAKLRIGEYLEYSNYIIVRLAKWEKVP